MNVPGKVPAMHIPAPPAILRTWREDDAPAIVRHADNPRVAAGLRDGFPSPYTEDDAYRFIALATEPDTGNLFLAIEMDGRACGGIGVHRLDDVYRRTGEIGYWLAEEYWGRGIATAAVRALVPVAFDHFDLVRLQAGIFASNPASMRVMEKSGFYREAVHRNAVTRNGVTMDEVMYARLR